MNDQSRKCSQVICVDTPNAISSQELGDGVTPYNLQDGRQIDLFGLEAVPASRFLVRGGKKEKQTNGICGLSGST